MKSGLNFTVPQIRTMVMQRVMDDLGRHMAVEALAAFDRAMDEYVQQHINLWTVFSGTGREENDN